VLSMLIVGTRRVCIVWSFTIGLPKAKTLMFITGIGLRLLYGYINDR
jgi:hypothetical protein